MRIKLSYITCSSLARKNSCFAWLKNMDTQSKLLLQHHYCIRGDCDYCLVLSTPCLSLGNALLLARRIPLFIVLLHYSMQTNCLLSLACILLRLSAS